MAFLKIATTILLLSSSLMAQLVIEEVGEDSSDTRIITMQTTEELEGRKNEWGAAFMSLGIPGLGQFYLQEKQKGAAFLSADVILLAGTIFTRATSIRKFEGSIGYAKTYADAQSNRAWDDGYWNDIGLHEGRITSDIDWNNDQYIKYRDFAKQYKDEDTWSWVSLASKESYVEQRENAGSWQTASYLLLGGMLINRVISFVDARVSAKRYNSNMLSSLEVFPYYAMSTGKTGFTILASF